MRRRRRRCSRRSPGRSSASGRIARRSRPEWHCCAHHCELRRRPPTDLDPGDASPARWRPGLPSRDDAVVVMTMVVVPVCAHGPWRRVNGHPGRASSARSVVAEEHVRLLAMARAIANCAAARRRSRRNDFRQPGPWRSASSGAISPSPRLSVTMHVLRAVSSIRL